MFCGEAVFCRKTRKLVLGSYKRCKFHLLFTYLWYFTVWHKSATGPPRPKGSSSWVVAYCVRGGRWGRFWSGHRGIMFCYGCRYCWQTGCQWQTQTLRHACLLCTHTLAGWAHTIIFVFIIFCCHAVHWRVSQPHTSMHTVDASDVALGFVGCRSNAVSLSLTVSLSQDGGSLVDSSGALRLPLYTAWLELNQKEVTSDL